MNKKTMTSKETIILNKLASLGQSFLTILKDALIPAPLSFTISNNGRAWGARKFSLRLLNIHPADMANRCRPK